MRRVVAVFVEEPRKAGALLESPQLFALSEASLEPHSFFPSIA